MRRRASSFIGVLRSCLRTCALLTIAATLTVLGHVAFAVFAAAAILAAARHLAVFGHHGAFVRCLVVAGHVLVCHGVLVIFRHHVALAILATAVAVLAGARHLAFGLVVVAAGTSLGLIAGGWRRGLGCALGHQGQSHN